MDIYPTIYDNEAPHRECTCKDCERHGELLPEDEFFTNQKWCKRCKRRQARKTARPAWVLTEEREAWRLDMYLYRDQIKQVWRNRLDLGDVIQAGLDSIRDKKCS